MKTPNTTSSSRLVREVEREREERHRHDDAKSYVSADEEFRTKDARENASSGQLNRQRTR